MNASAVMGSEMTRRVQKGNCLALTFRVFAVSGVFSSLQNCANIGLHDGSGVVVAVQPVRFPWMTGQACEMQIVPSAGFVRFSWTERPRMASTGLGRFARHERQFCCQVDWPALRGMTGQACHLLDLSASPGMWQIMPWMDLSTSRGMRVQVFISWFCSLLLE